MIRVEQALEHLFALAPPLGDETVPLAQAAGRVLARPVVAARAQPPFAASAMDGYALRAADAAPGAVLRVIGTAPAGRAHPGPVGPGEALRIFTGAPLPPGADTIVIQEDVTPEGDLIRLTAPARPGDHVRRAGQDFAIGDSLAAPRRLGPADLALAAAMNAPLVHVTRRPIVAILATGDELVMPGDTPRADQIIASNAFGLMAMFQAEGAEVRLLPIARDTRASLTAALALAEGADLVVTIGGASVGDHDLVAQMGTEAGMERAFYKVAMRPGKPLMAGRLGGMALVGLPGNPVSALVCGRLFVVPMLRAMLGLGRAPAPRVQALLATDLPANGPREHYMRAVLDQGRITPFDRQDSALLSILSQANALLVRPIDDGPRQAGAPVQAVLL